MNSFSKKNMITGESERPSKRYEMFLFNTLEKEGYKHLKSKNEFVKKFDFGKQVISLSYNSSFGYIGAVEYFVKIIFTDLEKMFKKVYPNYGWTNWTIHENLHWTDSSLSDPITGKCTDETIHNVANEFFNEIKPKVELIFSKINNYDALNKIYNSKPNEFIAYLPPSRLEKRIINGLILVKNMNPENYQKTYEQYLVLLDKYRGNDIDEIRIEVEQGIAFLNQNELKLKTMVNDSNN